MSQSFAQALQKPGGGSKMPASPWIGSIRTAAVSGVIAAATASASPKETLTKPGAKGPKPSRLACFRREADDGRGAAVACRLRR